MGIARPGAAVLALETGCEVLPVGLIGTERIWPRKGRFRPRWNAVSIRIGRPMSFREYEAAYASAGEEDRKLIIEGVSTLIMRRVAELSGKEYNHGVEAVDGLAAFEARPVAGGAGGGEHKGGASSNGF
jgi:1-acyl-sn-glycerol-3-phosphate acyltransferase